MYKMINRIIIMSSMAFYGLYSQVDPYVFNNFDTLEDAIDEGTGAYWTEDDQSDSETNYSNLSWYDALDMDNTSPVMDWNYSVVADLSWGEGFTAELKFYDQAIDLSNHNYLSFKVYNLVQPQNETVSFRVQLFDVSDATSWTSKDDVEVWYSFFEGDECVVNRSPDEGWVEYKIPLQGSGTQNGGTSYTLGFTRTGWVGIAGNNTFDKDQIAGLAFEVVNRVDDSTINGEFLMEDIQAVFSEDILGCMDQNACNYNPEATVDDGSCYECSDVTFNVDMALVEVVHPEGVYLAGGGFGQDGYLMEDADEDGIWSHTLSLKVGETFLYKFRNQPSFGTWDGFEPAGGLASGGCATGQYDDRFVVVSEEDMDLDVVCYGSCVSCEDASFINVTFSVNMQEEEVNAEGVWLAGGNFGGNPGFLLSDPDGDDIWTVTRPVAPETEITYKFVNGPIDANWGGAWEEVPSDCGVGDFNDRQYLVGSVDAEIPTVCFGGCMDCLGEYPVDVTFNLDMSGVDGFDGSEQPYVFGSYNNWDNFSTQTMLSDDDGDNVYTGTILDFTSTDSVTVLFGYGQTIETIPSECGVADSDLGLNVRELPLRDSQGEPTLVLDPVAFGNCPVDNTPRVLFQVDVSNVVADWPADFSLCVVGSFASWTGCGLQLTDEDGDGIYTGMVSDLEDGVGYEYKFLVNEGWGDPLTESGAPLGSACDFDPSDEFNNYGFIASEGPMLDLGIHTWNECPQQLSNDNEGKLLPERFTVLAYPNPFNPTVNIDYSLLNQELVNLSIINLLGQNVKTLVNDFQIPGDYSFKWDGKDINGVNLQSGIYFAVVTRESGYDIVKITYLK